MRRTDADRAAGEGRAPLAGRAILIPWGGARGESTAEAVRARGGEPVVAELLRIAPPRDPRALAASAERWNRGEFDWLVVTSANGAEAFVAAGGRARAGSRVAAVGPATAAALERCGLPAELVPETRFTGAGLAETLAAVAPEPASFLLPFSEIASETVERELRAAGHRVHRVDAYRTVAAAPSQSTIRRLASGGIDAILVTSGSAARSVAQHLGGALALAARGGARPRLAAIGGPSADALRDCGLSADVVAETHTVPGLLDALAAAYADPAPVPVADRASAAAEGEPT